MKSTLPLTAVLFGIAASTAQASDFLLHNETGHVLTSFVTKEKRRTLEPELD
jgi:hypothetical protein